MMRVLAFLLFSICYLLFDDVLRWILWLVSFLSVEEVESICRNDRSK